MRLFVTALLPVLACVPLEAPGPDEAVEAVEGPALGSASRALIGGVVPVEDNDLAAVALTSPQNFSFCTGTLVSPRVILTAAHCIDEAAGDPQVIAFFGTDIRGEGIRIGVMRAHPHPGWTGDLSDNHDIGMIVMNFRAPEGVDPIPLFSGDLTQYLGAEVRRVGFGIYDPETNASDGRKRIGTTTIHTIPTGQDWFYAGDEELITCRGDSGGPVFLDVDSEEVIAGVHSFGFGCTAPNNGSTRTDLYAESFVYPWIQQNDPTCREDGYCARIGCLDDPDCQPCGPDGTCVEDCPLPDPDCPTQEIGEICRANSHCQSGLCLTWEGDRTYRFCSRSCDPGAGDCPEGMSCQERASAGLVCYYDEAPPGLLGDPCDEPTDCGTYKCEEGVCVATCDLSIGVTCPTGFSCRSLDDGESYYCLADAIPRESGGCAAGSSRSGPGAALFSLLLGLSLLLLFSRARSARPRPGRVD